MSEGMPLHEVDRRVRQLNNRLLATPDGWREYFNSKYGAARARARLNQAVGFEPHPNALLQSVVRNLKPGKALDVAMGQGRNAIYLARQGWDVSGFDVSDVGLMIANSNARRAGVALRTSLASYSSYGYGAEQWDLIVMAYPFTPVSERFARMIVKSLRPGGVLVYEHLMATSDDSGLAAMGAVGMTHPDRLAELYSDLKIEQDEIVRKVPDWGPMEKVPVVRLVARKP